MRTDYNILCKVTLENTLILLSSLPFPCCRHQTSHDKILLGQVWSEPVTLPLMATHCLFQMVCPSSVEHPIAPAPNPTSTPLSVPLAVRPTTSVTGAVGQPNFPAKTTAGECQSTLGQPNFLQDQFYVSPCLTDVMGSPKS